MRVREDQKPPPQDASKCCPCAGRSKRPPPKIKEASTEDQNVRPQHMMHVPCKSDLQADLEIVGWLVAWLVACFIYKRG